MVTFTVCFDECESGIGALLAAISLWEIILIFPVSALFLFYFGFCEWYKAIAYAAAFIAAGVVSKTIDFSK